MHLIPYYIYSGCDAEKEKESSAPVSRVLCSYIRYAVMLCSYQI